MTYSVESGSGDNVNERVSYICKKDYWVVVIVCIVITSYTCTVVVQIWTFCTPAQILLNMQFTKQAKSNI